jgi:hypothetical protein
MIYDERFCSTSSVWGRSTLPYDAGSLTSDDDELTRVGVSCTIRQLTDLKE